MRRRLEILRIARVATLVLFALWFGLLWPIRIGASIVERDHRVPSALGCHSAPAEVAVPAPSPEKAVRDSVVPPCHQVAPSADERPKRAELSQTVVADAPSGPERTDGCHCSLGTSIGKRPCGCGHSLAAFPAPPDPMSWAHPPVLSRVPVLLSYEGRCLTVNGLNVVPATPPPNSSVCS